MGAVRTGSGTIQPPTPLKSKGSTNTKAARLNGFPDVDQMEGEQLTSWGCRELLDHCHIADVSPLEGLAKNEDVRLFFLPPFGCDTETVGTWELCNH